MFWWCVLSDAIIGLHFKSQPTPKCIKSVCHEFYIFCIAQVVQNHIETDHNKLFCQLLLMFPFIFSNCIMVLWTTISAYRLYLVITSGDKNAMKKAVKAENFHPKISTSSLFQCVCMISRPKVKESAIVCILRCSIAHWQWVCSRTNRTVTHNQ